MKKVVVIILFLGVIGSYFIGRNFLQGKVSGLWENSLNVEDEFAELEEYFIYGRYFNLKGVIGLEQENIKKLQLGFYHNEFYYYDLLYEKEEQEIHFQLSDYLNDGILLDEIAYGKYYLFLVITYIDKEEDKTLYYRIMNDTFYPKTSYYSLSFYEKEIVIQTENDYPTMVLDVCKEKKKDVYDIVIDPGHGGMDGGASFFKYKESSLTYEIASLLKKKLVQYGFRVMLTHQGNIPMDEVMDNYGMNGRSVIPQRVKAKYLFSLHLNSSTVDTVRGLEIYTASGIQYDFIRRLASNLVEDTGLSYSKNMDYQIENGIYSRNFTRNEIEESQVEAKRKGRMAYEITTRSNYFYMIRETGGFMTGAYVDNRNEQSVGENPYYNSNVGVESYILELGFISNRQDLNNLLEKKEQYAKSIAKTIYEALKKS